MNTLSGLLILGGLAVAAIEAWPWSLVLAAPVCWWLRRGRPPTG